MKGLKGVVGVPGDALAKLLMSRSTQSLCAYISVELAPSWFHSGVRLPKPGYRITYKNGQATHTEVNHFGRAFG